MKRILRIVWLMVLVGLASHSRLAARDFQDYALGLGDNYQVDLANLLPADRLRLAELRRWAADQPSYEAFLAELYQRRPQLFDQFVLVHDSGSLQYADLEHPRVILFGDGLFLAFAENPQTTRRRVEVIAFDRETRGFRFHEFRFSTGGVDEEVDPQTCQGCHGDPGKPLWNPYDFWPTVYGSAIARLGTVGERDAYLRLSRREPQAGIYQYLDLADPQGRRLKPLEAMTQYVTQLHWLQLMEQWRVSRERLEPLIYSILGVLNGCVPSLERDAMSAEWQRFLPDSLAASWAGDAYAGYQRMLAARRQFKDYLIARYEATFTDSRSIFSIDHDRLIDEARVMGQLAAILDRAGLSLAAMTMSQGQNPGFFGVPGNQAFDFLASMVFYDRELFTRLEPQVIQPSYSGFAWPRFDCAVLAAESRAALSAWQPSVEEPKNLQRASPIGPCIHCHVVATATSGAPPIPFDRSRQLAAWLSRGSPTGLARIKDRLTRSGPGRMPPQGGYSQAERESLRAIFEQLAAGAL